MYFYMNSEMLMIARSPDIAEKTRPLQGPAAGLPDQGPYRAVPGSPASGRFLQARARLLLRPLALAHFDGLQPEPFVLEDLCLFGEAADGRFHILNRYSLG